MDKSSQEVVKEKPSTSKKPQIKCDKIRKKPNKKVKGQKDIRALIKSKNNELLTYTKDFDLICKQSGIDVDPEQLQLAIALSKSLQENEYTHNDTNTVKSLTCNQRRSKIRTTLQEYGFQTKQAPVKKVKVYRKYYKLILVTDVEKKQKIADKFVQILIKNVIVSEVEKESSVKQDNINSDLYRLTTNVTYDCIKNDDIFYVNNLVPKSLHKRHIFKDWSRIPGRPVSPKFERPDYSFQNTECLQEELDEILSGSIKTAQEIVKKNYRNNILNSSKQEVTANPFINRTETIEIVSGFKDTAKIITQYKSIKDSFINKSIDTMTYNSKTEMSFPTHRSCSPDLFDDDNNTIIMDTSKDKISIQDEVSECAIMVKEQNDFMDLTNCVDVIKGKCTKPSKDNFRWSQSSNKSISNSHEFMDLTECVPASSQKYCNNLEEACTYEKYHESSSGVKKSESINIHYSPNFSNDIQPNQWSDKKSLHGTIITIDEEFIDNANIKNTITVLKSPQRLIIDSAGTQHKSPNLLNIATQHSDLIIDLDQDIEKSLMSNVNFEKNSNKSSIAALNLTKPSKFQDYISLLNISSMKSIVTCESNSLPNSETVLSRTFYKKTESEGEKKNEETSVKCDTLDSMDLTQSSNSEDFIEELVHDTCVKNNSFDNTIVMDTNDCIPITLLNDDDAKHNIVISEYLDNGNLEQDKHGGSDLVSDSKTTQNAELNKNTNSTKFVVDNDREFDTLVKNVSNSKSDITTKLNGKKCSNNGNSFNVLNECTVANALNNHETKLTQHYDFSSDKFSHLENFSNRLGKLKVNTRSKCNFVTNDSQVVDIDDENYEKIGNPKKYAYISNNTEISGTVFLKRNEGCNVNQSNLELFDIIENIDEKEHGIKNSDIDLTQKSDTSEDMLSGSNITKAADELGKQYNISIDYDEIYDKINNTRVLGTSIPVIKKIEENNKNGQDEVVLGSSQSTEVFELSDNEFNYSVNQHIHDNDSLTLQQAEFDIGGISIIDEFLNRNSLPRKSKIRCSCRSSDEPNNSNENVESCVPVLTLKNNDNLLNNNDNREPQSHEAIELVKISTPFKSRSEDNILIAETPKHNDYIIRTDQVTPMPNYERMTSPERNNELDKFGIKPLKRKRAIQLLTYIYNQTHPLMEIMSDDECSSPSKKRRKNNGESLPRRALVSDNNYIISTTPVFSDRASEALELQLSQNSSKLCKGSSKNSHRSRDINEESRECSQKSCKENNLYEKTTLTPDIRNIECSPDDWVFQKREKAKVHSCRVPLHIAFHNYVTSRKPLREAILKYEPINIDDIHKGLVAIGYRYNPKDLLKFMDRKCITVKTADNNSRKNKNM